MKAMIVYVDIEHESTHGKPHGERILAARARLTYRLEDLVGDTCMLARYNKVTPELLSTFAARAIFISGNSASIDTYGEELDGFLDVLRGTELPVFGFCGGLQFLALALDAPVVRLEPPDSTQDDVGHGERGYLPIEITEPHELLADLGDAPIFRHAHNLHVPEVPPGFTVHARTDITPVQVMIHEDRKIVGTQFHPEYWTDEHPAGKTMIENFVTWAGI